MRPTQLSMHPQGLESWLKFNFRGRWLFRRVFNQLARAKISDPKTRHRLQQAASRDLLEHLEVQVEVKGLQHIAAQPCVIAPLHESLADPLVVLQLGLPMRFVLREEILSWPTVGPALSNLDYIALNPEQGISGYRKLLREAKTVVSNESLVVFPQGSVLGLEVDFQRGAFALCKALQLPLLPLVLSGTHQIYEHPFGSRLRYGVRVRMEALEPIAAEVFQNQPLEQIRVRLQQQMKQHALQSDAPAPRRYLPERDGWWDGYRFEIDPQFSELAALVQARRQFGFSYPAKPNKPAALMQNT